MAKSEDKKPDKLFVDFVSHDKDWRGVIENELRCQEGWQRDWGFLADDTITEKPLTKEDKILVLEEKIKAMKDVKIMSTAKQSYRGGTIDFKPEIKGKKGSIAVIDLMPQSRRPKGISMAHKHLTEAIGKDYEREPYQNYLGSK